MDEWRNSKYVYAMGSIQAQLYQIRTVVKRLLSANDDLLAIGATLNGENAAYSSSSQIDLNGRGTWDVITYPFI
ncbi:hypothetical protein DPMN_177257 [Dreissena polymorpha]|uniref:Uncharacterized protein n=1 Tax=Dreissena polymorpha TaxID=45954 RepID=A0A9D4ILF9_DREPO|nr:hypothetical protein DPMN_177257 [Dreissena polymorpha]